MPYIQSESRAKLDPPIDALLIELGLDGSGGITYAVGELNYIFSSLLSTAVGVKPRYADLNAAIGVLECCKLELQRRLVAPYEDRKIEENGDVY